MQLTVHPFESRFEFYHELQLASSSHSGTCWYGNARKGKARKGKARKGKEIKERHDKAKHGMTLQGKARYI
jgi:hypothetical protein